MFERVPAASESADGREGGMYGECTGQSVKGEGRGRH